MWKKKIAFTLAEILIVLGIIGIIAEMTIPTVMHNVEIQIYATSLQKFYSSATQALTLMANDYGCPGDFACTGVFSSDADYLGKAIKPYFKIIKDCGTDSSGNTSCFPSIINNAYDGTGGTYNSNAVTSYKFVTADGMSVYINTAGGNCNTNYSNSGNGPMSKFCGWIHVDTNGLKGPNRNGVDNFNFWITNGKGAMLYPSGGIDDKYNGVNDYWNGPNPSCQAGYTNGSFCSGRMSEENWRMTYYGTSSSPTAPAPGS